MSGSRSSDRLRTPARLERSAGGVVLRRIEGETRVLVIHDPYDQWGLPKGHIEQDEREREAALREVREETGLEHLEIGPEIDTIDWRFDRDGVLVHKYCAFYLIHSPEGALRPEVEEGISECEWLSFPAAMDRIDYDNARDVVRKAREMVRDREHPFEL